MTSPFNKKKEDSADEGEDVVVNDEPAAEPSAATETEGEETEEKILASPFVKTNVLFTDPESIEFPAGKIVKLLVGFHNNGTSSFLVEGVEGSFRYPQDFTYYIQNVILISSISSNRKWMKKIHLYLYIFFF